MSSGVSIFRDDITGLRAISVLLVVLFHFDVPPFHGGFIGVDVFFVISGFLMTKIIVGGLDLGNFRLVDFYGARIRRIVPALAVLSVALLIVGGILFDPLTYEAVSKAALSSTTFVSNVTAMREMGYFHAEATKRNFFLHTWSLSLEWQYYIILPLALCALSRWRWAWRNRLPIFLLGAAFSFAATIVALGDNRDTYAFYLLPFRAWEMLIGGAVFLCPAPRIRELTRRSLSLAGVGLIFAASVLVDHNTPWPGLWAIAPVGGAALTLFGDTGDDKAWRFPGAQLVGAASYSIYLWHWPVLVFGRYFELSPSTLHTTLGIGCSLGLGLLSYHYVELRFLGRTARHAVLAPSRRMSRPSLGILYLIAVAFAYLVFSFRGLEDLRSREFPAETRNAMAEYKLAMTDFDFPGACLLGRVEVEGLLTICRVGDSTSRDVLVIGDSHAQQYVPRYRENLPSGVGAITFVTSAGCVPLPGVGSRSRRDCEAFVKEAFEYASRQQFRKIVIVSAWAPFLGDANVDQRARIYYSRAGAEVPAPRDPQEFELWVSDTFRDFGETLRLLRVGGSRICLLLPSPVDEEQAARALYRRAFQTKQAQIEKIDRAAFQRRTAFVRLQLEQLSRAVDGVEIVDPQDSLCGPTSCEARGTSRLSHTDGAHIRASVVGNAEFSYMDRCVRPDA